MNPLMEVKSHIRGKNAILRIFSDRIEWEVKRGVSAGKITAGVMTAGLSMLATGVKNGKAGTELIPMRAVTSVTTKRDGPFNAIVSIIAAGNSVDVRISHKEAEQARGLILNAINGGA